MQNLKKAAASDPSCTVGRISQLTHQASFLFLERTLMATNLVWVCVKVLKANVTKQYEQTNKQRNTPKYHPILVKPAAKDKDATEETRGVLQVQVDISAGQTLWRQRGDCSKIKRRDWGDKVLISGLVLKARGLNPQDLHRKGQMWQSTLRIPGLRRWQQQQHLWGSLDKQFSLLGDFQTNERSSLKKRWTLFLWNN